MISVQATACTENQGFPYSFKGPLLALGNLDRQTEGCRLVGRIVADNISSLDDAMLIAAAPSFYEAGGDAWFVFENAREDFPGWGELADKLGAALDAAKYSRAGEANKEEEED